MYFGKYDKVHRDKRKMKVFSSVEEESDYLDIMYLCREEGPIYSKSTELLLINLIIIYYISYFLHIFSILLFLMIIQFMENRANDFEYLHNQIIEEDAAVPYMDDIGDDFFYG